MLEELQQANRNYAKRQFTWFKKMRDFLSIDLETLSEEEFVEMCLKDLGVFSSNLL
jgi:tRNA A37 N6-isopentenylltransferase MiaA